MQLAAQSGGAARLITLGDCGIKRGQNHMRRDPRSSARCACAAAGPAFTRVPVVDMEELRGPGRPWAVRQLLDAAHSVVRALAAL